MRRILSGLAAVALLLCGTGEAFADLFTYDFQNYPSFQNGFTLSGTITTDIDTGTLTAPDITAWSITITSAGGSATTYDSTMSGSSVSGSVTVNPTAITATTDEVLAFGDASGYSPLQYNRDTPNYYYISYPSPGNINWFDSLGPTSLGGDPWIIATAPTSAVPEPSNLTVFVIGMAGIAGYRWRRRKLACI